MKTAFFGPWVGEFGWELMAWQGFCRLKARDYDKVYVSSFPDMEFLYEDFADEFIPHDYPKRKQEFDEIDDVHIDIVPHVDSQFKPFKEYRVPDQHFIQYGDHLPIDHPVDILIHARNIRYAHKNYPEEKWEQIVDGIREVLDTDAIASIGKCPDLHIEGTHDLRGIPLDYLCDRIASSKVVVGGSSGIMHLATLCNTPVVVWGDRRTYFNETLETRYKKTWNPFGSEVSFVFDDKWQPDPHEIINIAQTKCLGKLTKDIEMRDQLEDNIGKIEPDSINSTSTSVGSSSSSSSSSSSAKSSIIKDEGEGKTKTLKIGTDAAEALTQAVESGRYLLTISWITEETPKGSSGSNYKFAHNLTKQDFPDDQVIHCFNHFRKQDSQSPSAKAGLRELLSSELDGKKRFS